MKPIKILLIEDNDKHLSSAKAFFSTMSDVEVEYAEDFYGALEISGGESEILKKYDGIISDVHFPINDFPNKPSFTNPNPIGMGIALFAAVFNIPFVLITDKYHHTEECEWIERIFRSMPTGVRGRFVDSTGGVKNWEDAYCSIKMFLGIKN